MQIKQTLHLDHLRCKSPEMVRRELWVTLLAYIADNEVANRPGRIEPRVLKRRRHRYPLMQSSRDQLRKKLDKT